MRALLLFIGLAILADARAQTTPFDSSRATPVDASTGLVLLEVIESDAPAATPALADALLRALGRPWREVVRELAPPDTSTVQSGRGDATWSVPGYPVDGFSAFVQRGIVESVRLDFTDEGPDLAGFADRLYARLGSPRPDGFYATDQTGFRFSLAVDRRANRLDARAVPGQLVGDDVPLPVQFSTVPYEARTEVASSPLDPAPLASSRSASAPDADSIYAYADPAPGVAGGLEAIREAGVYPLGATAGGTVFVELVVERDGTGGNERVVRSVDGVLDAAALQTVRQLSFTPGAVDGVPVRARLTLPVRFADPPENAEAVPPVLIGGLEGLQGRIRFPERARRGDVDGTLFFSLVVGRDGLPRDVKLELAASEIRCRVVESSACEIGKKQLVEAALRGILDSRFEPGTIDGVPVIVRYALPVRFLLR